MEEMKSKTEMTLTRAIDIVKHRLLLSEATAETVGMITAAIEKVANMETHKDITKDELVNSLLWLFDNYDFSAAAEVIRCSECAKQGDEEEWPLLCFAQFTMPDEFCSQGKRKEDEEMKDSKEFQPCRVIARTETELEAADEIFVKADEIFDIYVKLLNVAEKLVEDQPEAAPRYLAVAEECEKIQKVYMGAAVVYARSVTAFAKAVDRFAGLLNEDLEAKINEYLSE